MGDLVNFVTDISPEVLASQQPELPFEVIYSKEPLAADWHVVLGLVNEMEIPNTSRRTIFFALEPPEVLRYDTNVLTLYGLVVSARFQYLRRLHNLRVESGILPWRVGIAYESGAPQVINPRSGLAADTLQTGNYVSVVTSRKTVTKEQERRLRLIDFLASRLPELIIFGREFRPITDKADALSVGRYHLALENCRQDGYWTEKLADPVLMQNITFYSGKNCWARSFKSRRAIVEIDSSNPRRTYEIIRRTLDSECYQAAIPELRSNKDQILNHSNLHHAAMRAISALQKNYGIRDKKFEVPKHSSRLQALLGTIQRYPKRYGAR